MQLASRPAFPSEQHKQSCINSIHTQRSIINVTPIQRPPSKSQVASYDVTIQDCIFCSSRMKSVILSRRRKYYGLLQVSASFVGRGHICSMGLHIYILQISTSDVLLLITYDGGWLINVSSKPPIETMENMLNSHPFFHFVRQSQGMLV